MAGSACIEDGSAETAKKQFKLANEWRVATDGQTRRKRVENKLLQKPAAQGGVAQHPPPTQRVPWLIA